MGWAKYTEDDNEIIMDRLYLRSAAEPEPQIRATATVTPVALRRLQKEQKKNYRKEVMTSV